MTTYIPIFIILFICGLFILISIMLIAILIWVFKRNADIWQSAGKALQGDAKSHLTEQAHILLPWDDKALSDFSAILEINGQQVFNKLHYRGRLKSLAKPDTPGWLVFDLQLTTGKGPLQAQTDKSRYTLNLIGGLFQEIAAEVYVDGIRLGWVRAQGQRIVLESMDHLPMGQYSRPSKGLRLSLQSIYYLQPGFFEPTFTPVEIKGRQVAEFNTNLILGQHLKFLQDPIPALYRNISPNLTSEEQDWLVTLAILESYLRIVRHLSEKRH